MTLSIRRANEIVSIMFICICGYLRTCLQSLVEVLAEILPVSAYVIYLQLELVVAGSLAS